MKFLDFHKLTQLFASNKASDPFDHWVIDGFFHDDIARQLGSEFPDYDDENWLLFNNAIEFKKSLNIWYYFPRLTYSVFEFLNSQLFLEFLEQATGVSPLYADCGLNGGGWHIHKSGGKLNPHLDYSIHPKLGLQRKLNIIVYLTADWQPGWGGSTGLWRQEEAVKKPGELVIQVEPVFNRAIIFDTTQNSWHGLPAPINCPEGICRKTLAVYYLIPPEENADPRGKALFAPTPEQENDSDVLELIRKRADVNLAKSVYEY